jgi:hypothetical protein
MRARRRPRLPVVLSEAELRLVRERLDGGICSCLHQSLMQALQKHRLAVPQQHRSDRAATWGRLLMPNVLAKADWPRRLLMPNVLAKADWPRRLLMPTVRGGGMGGPAAESSA